LARILILGLGNPLMGDDGIGAAIVEDLQRRHPVEGLRAEVAPDILHLTSLWDGELDVWLVDAVSGGGPPGAIHIMGHERIFGLEDVHRSAHQLSLPEGLRWLIHGYPELSKARFRLWGIEPGQIVAASGLTPVVAAAAEALSQAIAREADRRLRRRAAAPGSC